MNRRTIVALTVAVIIISSSAIFVGIQHLPRKERPHSGEGESPQSHSMKNEYVFRFTDRYGIGVQTHFFVPVNSSGPSPALVLCEGWKADNSIYKWLARNLTEMGFFVMAIDFVNNSSPWAETQTGRLSGMYCDTFGANSSLPGKYSGDSTLWPDLWPWVNEIIDAVRWLYNATTRGFYIVNDYGSIDLLGLIDPQRIGVIGHSTGASMGFVAATVEKRIRMSIMLAPYDDPNAVYWPPYPSDYTQFKLSIPAMILVGTLDAVTPKRQNADRLYSDLSDPKIEVSILGGNHMYFVDNSVLIREKTDIFNDNPATINATQQKEYSMTFIKAFLDYYFYCNLTHSPYNIDNDLTGDGSADVVLSSEEGEIIQDIKYGFTQELRTYVSASVVPRGIGWPPSYVQVRFLIPLTNTSLRTYNMTFIYGTYTEDFAGTYYIEVDITGTFTIEVVAMDVRGYRYTMQKVGIVLK